MESIDLVIGVIAIVYGAFLYSGNARIFKDPRMKKIYDERKIGKAFGVGVILMGLATFVSWKFNTFYVNIGYIIFILADFLLSVLYMKKCCRLDDK